MAAPNVVVNADYVVVYHKGCPDGLASACIVQYFLQKEKFQGTVYYIGADPDEKKMLALVEVLKKTFVEDIPLYFLDLAFSPAIYQAVKSYFQDFAIIDHHKETAALESEIEVYFDKNESGASLTWQYYFGPAEKEKDVTLPLYIRYVKDRDLFLFHEKDAHVVDAGLRRLTWFRYMPIEKCEANPVPRILQFNGQELSLGEKPSAIDFHMMSFLESDKWLEEAMRIGQPFINFRDEEIRSLSYSSAPITIGEHKVRVINAGVHISDLGKYLYENVDKDCDYVFIWRYDHMAKRCYVSLRSAKGKADVHAVAKRYGGGGHENAAGIECSLSELQKIIEPA